MKILIWQWGRYGSMPRIAALLAKALASLPGFEPVLSLSSGAELLRSATPPHCHLPMDTYRGPFSFALRVASAPFAFLRLVRRINALRPDIAICVHPGPLDPLMTSALRRTGVPFVVLVHDPDPHPGDGVPFLIHIQRFVCRQAAALGTLSSHVAERLTELKMTGTGRPILRLRHPPLAFVMPNPPLRRGNAFHLLMFGRLLEYKGLDLLAEALTVLGPRPDLAVRVVGNGPDGPALRALRKLPGVSVEVGWVPETEIGALLAWSDALVLPYREASQSGVAAAAQGAGRWLLSTRVGGLPEQLKGYSRALLCDADADGLAGGLEQLLAMHTCIEAPAIDCDADWREMAASLMRQMADHGLCGKSRAN